MASFGDIVWIEELRDRNGVNPKTRPCVIVSPPGELAAGGPVRVVPISTLLPGPLPDGVVPMKWRRDGHPKTGLTTRCAAVARWVPAVDHSKILGRIGHVPPADLDAILAIMKRNEDDGAP